MSRMYWHVCIHMCTYVYIHVYIYMYVCILRVYIHLHLSALALASSLKALQLSVANAAFGPGLQTQQSRGYRGDSRTALLKHPMRIGPNNCKSRITYICICMYIYIYVYIHMHVCIYIYIPPHVCFIILWHIWCIWYGPEFNYQYTVRCIVEVCDTKPSWECGTMMLMLVEGPYKELPTYMPTACGTNAGGSTEPVQRVLESFVRSEWVQID